jgi:acetyltransferase-like isoleucine patch superfamily enzyme
MLKKIFSIFRNSPAPPPNYEVGNGSRITGTVYKAHPSSNITIGNSCFIEGTLTTYTPGAEIIIGDKVFIGPGSLVGSAGKITIGNNVLVSFDCVIQDNDTHSIRPEERENDVTGWMTGKKDWSKIQSRPIVIESHAWIGARCIILKGVTIGRNAVVGAGSVVTRNVESNTIVAGNPARVIKRIS